MRVEKRVKRAQSIMTLNKYTPDQRAAFDGLVPDPVGNLLASEILGDSPSDSGRGSDDLHKKVCAPLTFPGLCQQNRTVAIKKPSDKRGHVIFRDLRPVCIQAFAFGQSKRTQSPGYGLRGKRHSPCFSFAVRANAVGLADKPRDDLQKVTVFRRDMNRVALERAIRPDKTEQPCEIITPGFKKNLVKREAKHRESKPRTTSMPEPSAPAYLAVTVIT